MPFLNTLDVGQYSPTLCIRGGVNYCQQILIPDSGVNIAQNIYYSIDNMYRNSRINGRYNLESNFNAGYYNFDNKLNGYYLSTDSTMSGVIVGGYHLNYWGINSHRIANDATYQFSSNHTNLNVCSATVISGQVSDNGASVYFNSPKSGLNMTDGFAIYGRFRVGVYDGRSVSTNKIIFVIGNGVTSPVGGSYPFSQNFLQLEHASSNKFLWRAMYNSSTSTPFNMNQAFDETSEYYNFLVSYSSGTELLKFYESLDSEPLTLTNITTIPSDFYSKFNHTYICDDTYGDTVKAPKIWTDIGISNRYWTSNDIMEFEQHRLNHAYTIVESPSSKLPYPSGSDTNYLNFHFPVHSSGILGSCSSGNAYECSFAIPLNSGISEYLYEFDRLSTNPTALYLDMWVENSGTNPSGHIDSLITFNEIVHVFGADYPSIKYYWSGYPITINNNGLNRVRMSGELYDENNQRADLIDVARNRANQSYLFLNGRYDNINTEYNGDIKIYSARVYLDGYCVPPTGISSITLYTSGSPTRTSSLDLYIQNNAVENHCDLYICGAESNNNNCTLYICSSFSFNSTTLCINGHSSTNNNCTLFINGATQTASMPLYIYSQPPGEMSGNIPLYMWATTHSGNANNVSLFIGENAPSGVKGAGMNLYTLGPNSARVTGTMNLFLRREYEQPSSSLTLYCNNKWTGAHGQITLFMNSPSGTDGAIPSSGHMNLFMARSSEAIDGGIPMVTRGPIPSSDAISLFMDGGTPNFSSINMMTDGKGVDTDKLRLYINGF